MCFDKYLCHHLALEHLSVGGVHGDVGGVKKCALAGCEGVRWKDLTAMGVPRGRGASWRLGVHSCRN
jgi:hypothetical protein